MLGNQNLSESKSIVITRRMFILASAKIFIFVAIVSRLIYLQISENIKYRSLSDKNRLREWKVIPERGIIEDYFGKKIAENTQLFQLPSTLLQQLRHYLKDQGQNHLHLQRQCSFP